MKCILPFDMSPGCITYHNKAFSLGMIKANIRDYDVWLADRYINCIYRNEKNSFGLPEKDTWGDQSGLTELKKWSIIPDDTYNRKSNVIDLLECMLQDGYYVTGIFNEYYIPGKTSYMSVDYLHDYMLLGFDDSRNVFFSVGYMNTQRYKKFEIVYSDFLKSLRQPKEDRVTFWFRKINMDYSVRFDVEYIVQRMEEYVNSICIQEHLAPGDVSGLKAWNRLAEYIKENTNLLDIRYTRLYMEHKDMMLARLKVLCDRGYLNNSLLGEYKEKIVRQARLAYYMSLKSNVSYDLNINGRIALLITDINASEYVLLSEATRQIRRCMDHVFSEIES